MIGSTWGLELSIRGQCLFHKNSIRFFSKLSMKVVGFIKLSIMTPVCEPIFSFKIGARGLLYRLTHALTIISRMKVKVIWSRIESLALAVEKVDKVHELCSDTLLIKEHFEVGQYVLETYVKLQHLGITK